MRDVFFFLKYVRKERLKCVCVSEWVVCFVGVGKMCSCGLVTVDKD